MSSSSVDFTLGRSERAGRPARSDFAFSVLTEASEVRIDRLFELARSE